MSPTGIAASVTRHENDSKTRARSRTDMVIFSKPSHFGVPCMSVPVCEGNGFMEFQDSNFVKAHVIEGLMILMPIIDV